MSLSLYIYIYMYMCVYIYIYIYIYAHTYTCIVINIFIVMYRCIVRGNLPCFYTLIGSPRTRLPDPPPQRIGLNYNI